MPPRRKLLHLARNFTMPIDAVTQTISILARRGAGKTHTAVVLVEEMLRLGLLTVIVDPTDVWWGLRTSRDGKKRGYPIVVFGGPHGDIPLTEDMGDQLAHLVMDQHVPMILSLKHLRKAKQIRFMTRFAETLYHENKSPMHLVIDEADVFAPQRPEKGKGAEDCLGRVEDIVRRGRASGIGVTLVSQRSAVLNKNVLSQTEVLITLQTTAPQDKAAIDAWVKENGDEEERDELMQTIAKLPKGVAWIWSPQWLECFERVRIRQRRTFDSSATPKVGVRRRDPKRRALPDIDAIRASFEEVIREAEADDPDLLRQRIRDLETELEARPTEIETREVIKTRKVRLLPKSEILRMLNMGKKLSSSIDRLTGELVSSHGDVSMSYSVKTPEAKPKTTPVTPISRARAKEPSDSTGIGKAHKAILTVLHTYGARSKIQLAFLAGYSHRGGAFNNPISNLRSRGWIEGRGDISLTTEGASYAAHYATSSNLPTGKALLNHWLGMSRFGKAHRAILTEVANMWPGGLSKQLLAELTAYAPTGGAFNNPLSRLRSLKLIEGSDSIRLTEEFGKAINR
jgi:hypothetical protein